MIYPYIERPYSVQRGACRFHLILMAMVLCLRRENDNQNQFSTSVGRLGLSSNVDEGGFLNGLLMKNWGPSNRQFVHTDFGCVGSTYIKVGNQRQKTHFPIGCGIIFPQLRKGQYTITIIVTIFDLTSINVNRYVEKYNDWHLSDTKLDYPVPVP